MMSLSSSQSGDGVKTDGVGMTWNADSDTLWLNCSVLLKGPWPLVLHDIMGN